jgi:hypothetical protein
MWLRSWKYNALSFRAKREIFLLIKSGAAIARRFLPAVEMTIDEPVLLNVTNAL